MAPPAPKQPKVFCQFPVQLVIEAILLVIAASVSFELALPLVLVAIVFPAYCFAKAEPPESASS
ncbi:hypothetical protein AN478_02780 [Thiohalorhabdus denitrificans]|uniref:Uncharacterized protein n=1 Tax=Thiohalorhabdus denitrificans TaxID=381306 RepID=A0A0P9CEX6_9GAMM|nr:hypothetical protein [Thiohalorhabdus denitrificans]KPV41508.1 hypothetical protein AN478_02780 [Thiohalorhabdus denitrificans]SCY29927.1 hypothetical protein SAMN05661077_1756 [Thiohalorhabdus denitrificans]